MPSLFFLIFVLIWIVKVVSCVLRNVKPLNTGQWKRQKNYRSRGTYDARDRRRRREQVRSRKELSFIEIAEHLDGKLTIEYPGGKIQFSYKGTPFTAVVQQKYGSQIVRVSSRWPDTNFRLKVFPDGKKKKRARYRGVQDIEIGEKKFDRDFVVQGNNVNGVIQMLDGKVARSIRKHWKTAHSRIDVDVGGGTITFGGKSNRILRNLQIVAIIKNFARIHCQMLEAFSGFQPDDFATLEMTYIEQESSTCMICGVQVGDEGVDCIRCKTRHHKDCWEYFGQCSTYGCHSRRAE